MTALSARDYMMSDDRTHRYWWTWIPAHPLSHEDKWYCILRVVFADHTTNCYANGNWLGFYTENLRDKKGEKQGNHATIGVFHTFSALPSVNWAELVLRECGIEFQPPITSVRWQYQLQGPDPEGGELHADIAMRVVDAEGIEGEFAVVFEAKGRGERLKDKDRDDSYLRLPQLSGFKRKFVVLLLDEIDIANVSANRPSTTWQAVAKIQLKEIERLDLPPATKRHLLALMRSHLHWYGIAGTDPIEDASAMEPLGRLHMRGLNPRIAALVRGAKIVVRVRKRLPVSAPAGFEHEPSIEDYSARPFFPKGTDWTKEVW
jgi:hypothetical protein